MVFLKKERFYNSATYVWPMQDYSTSTHLATPIRKQFTKNFWMKIHLKTWRIVIPDVGTLKFSRHIEVKRGNFRELDSEKLLQVSRSYIFLEARFSRFRKWMKVLRLGSIKAKTCSPRYRNRHRIRGIDSRSIPFGALVLPLDVGNENNPELSPESRTETFLRTSPTFCHSTVAPFDIGEG